MIDSLPAAKELLADRGYDADWFRDALNAKGIAPCIPSRSSRSRAIAHNRMLYRQRHRIENMFGRLKHWRRKHWRRIATRYDRCAHTCMSALALAAAVIFWRPINQS